MIEMKRFIGYLNLIPGQNPCDINLDDACITEGLTYETSHNRRHLDLLSAPLSAPSRQTLTRPHIHVNKCICISMSGGVLCSLHRSILGLEIAVYNYVIYTSIYIYKSMCQIQFLFSLIHSEPMFVL